MTSPDASNASGVGGRVGGRLATLLADTTVYTRQKMAPHQAGVANQVLTDFTNHVSDEIRGVMGDLWAKFADDPNTPETFRPVMQSLAQDRGQAWAWIGGLVTSTAMSTGLLDGLNNEFAPLVQSWIASMPNSLISVADMAQAEARSLKGGLNGDEEAKRQGFNHDRYRVLVELARARLTPGEVLEAWRHGLIDRANADAMLIKLGYSDPDRSAMLGLRDIPLSPMDAAAAWARSELTEAQTDHIGAKSGVTADDMRILRTLAGQPPDVTDVLLAWRRGIITDKDVDRALIQGPIRNEWLPVIKALQWQPLPVAEAADAVNQGHLTIEQAQRYARENGVKPEDFQVVVDNAGIPPGPQEALDWVNRGILTEQQFREAFLESRIKNKYIDLYLQSRYEVMPPETIRLMVSRGVLSKEDGVHRLMQRGYTADDAAIIIDGASAKKTEKSRDLTVAQTLELRADGLITDEDAYAMLQAAGYDADEALWVTELADLRRVARFVTAAVNRIKAGYVAGRLDEVRAGAALDRLNLPAQFKDDAFALWDIERTTLTKGLTPAQVVSAVKKDLITPLEAMARLTGQGYAPDDAAILLGIAGIDVRQA